MTADNNLHHFYMKRFARLLIPMFTILTPFFIYRFSQEGISPVRILIKLFLHLSTLQFWIDGFQQTWFSISICLSYVFQITASHSLGFINRIFRFLGSITLEMYLVHIMAIIIYNRSAFHERGNLIRYFILMLLCFIASYLYSLLDMWLIKRLNRRLLKTK